MDKEIKKTIDLIIETHTSNELKSIYSYIGRTLKTINSDSVVNMKKILKRFGLENRITEE